MPNDRSCDVMPLAGRTAGRPFPTQDVADGVTADGRCGGATGGVTPHRCRPAPGGIDEKSPYATSACFAANAGAALATGP